MLVMTVGDIRKVDVRGGRKEKRSRADPDLRCACCGESENVAPHPRMELVLICADCLEGSMLPVELFELGVGD